MAYSDSMNNFIYKQFGILTESIKNDKKEIINNIYKGYDKETGNKWDSSKANAFQHAYESAKTVYDYSKSMSPANAAALATQKGVFAEWSTWSKTTVNDTNKDLVNNSIGINEALNAIANGTSLQDLGRQIYDKIQSGEGGYVITPEDSDANPYIPELSREKLGEMMLAGFLAFGISKSAIGRLILGGNDLLKPIIEDFNEAKIIFPAHIDPLIIDLDGNGVETVSVEEGYMIDHEGDGFKELSAWVGGNDGILAYDKNNNGKIDNGNELFGDNYVKADGTVATSGFDALSDLDTNKDGVINSSDANFSDLQVIKADGSIISIEEAGIESINLTYQSKGDVDVNGNKLLGLGSYTTVDGQSRDIGDYALQVDKAHSIEANKVDISNEIAALPDILESGTVHSLHQAMALDETGELQELVESFIAETDIGEKKQLLTQILYKWTGADLVEDGSRGENVDAKELHVIEQFLGDVFIGHGESYEPNAMAGNLLKNVYTNLNSFIYAQLEVQTGLKSVYDMIQFKTDADTGTLIFDISAVKDHIAGVIATDELAGQMLLTDFCQTFLTLGYDENSNYSEFYDYFASYGQDYVMLLDSADKIVRYGTNGDDNIEGTAEQEAVFAQGGNDTIYTRQGDDLVYAGDGDDYIDTCEDNDKIYGENGNDTIITGWGNDTVYGGDGDDSIHNTGGQDYLDGGDGNDTLIGYWAGGETFIGGKGDDVITAESTDDTFIFNLGDGNDTISDSKGTDIIKFGEGITAENTIFSTEGNDMKITFKNSEDSILIKNAAVSPDNRIESYEFADGTIYSIEEVLTKLTTYGTSGDDTITLSFLNNKIYGYEGNDSIITGKGNDTVYGGDGDDSIHNTGGQDYLDGGDGNDTLIGYWAGGDTFIGGKGDDVITAESTDDTFIFNLGDGNDTISDSKGTDIIKFGEGITAENTIFSTEGSDIKITFKNSNDSILIKNAAVSPDNRIESYEFADGTIHSLEDVLTKLTTYGTSGDDTITLSFLNNKIYGYEGNDTIITGRGNDTVYGGDGDDSIHNTGGQDYLDGGDGNDTLIGYWAGGETFIGGKGDDVITAESTDDTFIFNLGDGNDTIYDKLGTDTLKFGEGIAAENTIFSTEGNDMKITFKNSEDSILIKNAAVSPNNRIESYEFADGTIYSLEDVLTKLTTYGTSGDDTITLSFLNNKIYGYEGNDSIITGKGNDTVYGGDGDDYIENPSGSDVLYGGAGNDTIIGAYYQGDTFVGGLGNDSITAESNSDTFIFNLGDGNDTIYDKLGTDTLKFGEGITAENTIFTGLDKDNAMLITFKNSDDSILIKNAAGSPNNRIESYEFADGTVLTIDEVLSKMATHGTSGDDVLTDSLLPEKIYGYAGNDSITVKYGNDTVYGGEGNDTLISDGANNILEGGLGNDYLQGAVWNDTYVFNLDDGNDTILDTRGTDTLQFGEGITLENIIFTGLKNGNDNDFLITFKNTNDSILIKHGANIGDNQIDKYVFSDGTELTIEEARNLATTYGTDADDTITGSVLSEKIYGYGGNDSINTGDGNDTVYGGEGDDYIENSNGDDVLYGDAGNDTIINSRGDSSLIGGEGNDSIQGGGWNDTFVFNLGDGNDTILDTRGTDTLQFGEGITLENVIFTGLKNGNDNDFLITFKNTNDSILIKHGANIGDNQIEKYVFSDGTELTIEEARNLAATYGTDADDTITGSVLSEKIYGYGGNDSINSGEGDDTVYGGDGDDYIENSNGDDVLYGDAGNDTIINSRGDSTLIGGEGNDSIRGASWNDLFIFNLGDGNDTIDARGGQDTILFDSNVNKNDIAIFIDNQNNLFIDYGQESGTDKIQAVGNSVENITIGDYTLTESAINKLIQDMSAYATEQGLSLSTVEDVKNNADLMNMVNSAWTEAA